MLPATDILALHLGTSQAVVLWRLQRTSRLRSQQVLDGTKPSSFGACRSPPEFEQGHILEPEPVIMRQRLQITFALRADPARLPVSSIISQTRPGLTRRRVRPGALGLSVSCDPPYRIVSAVFFSRVFSIISTPHRQRPQSLFAVKPSASPRSPPDPISSRNHLPPCRLRLLRAPPDPVSSYHLPHLPLCSLRAVANRGGHNCGSRP
jgi:hypothetical protein